MDAADEGPISGVPEALVSCCALRYRLNRVQLKHTVSIVMTVGLIDSHILFGVLPERLNDPLNYHLSDIITGCFVRADSSMASVTSNVSRPSCAVVCELGVPVAR